MKNIFLLAAMAAATLTSCSQNETFDDSSNGGQKAVSFSSYMTKATDAVIGDLQTSGIVVYAQKSAAASTDVPAAFPADFMNAQDVTYAAGAWTYSPKKYWPATGFVDFIAVPKGAVTMDLTSGATFEFTTGATPAAQKDLVVATALGKSSSDAAVMLSFKHILSRIEFKASFDKTVAPLTLKVTDITVKAVNPTATYSFAGAGTWGVASGTASDMVTSLAAAMNSVAADDAAVSATGTDGALMVVPQAATSVTVSYEVLQGSDVVESVTDKVITLSGNWEKGTKYVYNLKFTSTAKEVSFDVEVDNTWAGGSDTDTPVL